MRYNKLVRDNIPEIIRKKGAIPVTHTADEKEYWQKLKEKLQEEIDEFKKEESKEELCDILEVIHAIADHKKISMKDLEAYRQKKASERGGFSKRIILDETKEA